MRSRLVLVALVACLISAASSTLIVAPPSPASTSAKVGLHMFDLLYYGHDRGLGITPTGRGYEQINSGCCCPCFGIAFQLSHVRGTIDFAAATATVLRLYGTTNGYPAPSPLPHVGQRGVVQLRGGVFIDSLTGERYCAPNARGTAPCGA